MTAALLIAGFSCLAAGALTDLVVGVAGRVARAVPYIVALVGSGVMMTAGIEALSGPSMNVSLGHLLGLGMTSVRADRLSALFLTFLFALAVAISSCALSWIGREGAPRRRGLAAGFCMMLAAVAAIVVAGDAFSFLFSWEILTLSFYVLVGTPRAHRRQASASWLTLATGQVSGACLLFGFLLLAASAGSYQLAAWRMVALGPLHDFAYAFLVVGFAAKLGVVPLQAWMPLSYPSVPGPARAAMAGVAANVGVYGLWRTLSLLGRPPVWLVVGVLLVGGITAVLGVAFAGVDRRLSRVLAYSSVENGGIILTGFGIALSGALSGSRALEAAGLLAASLQAVAHAAAKSLLFSASANIEEAFPSDDLGALRGVGRVLPFSGTAFAAGALTLAGLPPTVGFVSEWFILEALMQEFRLPGLAVKLAMAGAGALVALTAGLAALAFVRILGLVILGEPIAGDRRAERGAAGRLGLGVLAGSCFALAALTPLEVRVVARGLSPVVGSRIVLQALRSAWVLQPIFPGFSILSPSWLYVALPGLVVIVTLFALLASGGRYAKVRRVPAWRSATAGVHGQSSYTAFGFANPLRHVLANVLGTRQETLVVESPADAARGRGPVEYTTTVVEPVEAYLYRPLRRAALGASALVRRLQSGRLEAYVGYMLFALVVALAITAALH